MKFFGPNNPDMSERLCIYILSLLDPQSLSLLREVSKDWRDVIDKTKKNMALLPTIGQVPLLAPYSLAKMDIKQFSGGMTNRTYKVDFYPSELKVPEEVVLRVPGQGSSRFIDRDCEKANAIDASSRGINVDVLSNDKGLQVTRFLKGNQAVTKSIVEDPRVLRGIAQVLKDLHSLKKLFGNTVFPFTRNNDLIAALKANHNILPSDLDVVVEKVGQIELIFNRYSIQRVPCHCDTTMGNFLLPPRDEGDEVKVNIIDWEYSGNNDKIWDLAYFATEAKLRREQEVNLLTSYFGECNDYMLAWFDLYKPVIAWWNTIWSWTQMASKADACSIEIYQKYAEAYYLNTKEFLDSPRFNEALQLIKSYADDVLHDGSDESMDKSLVPRLF